MRPVGMKAPIRVTPVYETYWRFAAERQRMFFRRLEGQAPYTEDPILAKHRFTNAYRAADRVSQFLISSVIYNGETASAEDVFFRTLLFRIFNKIETWLCLERDLGVIRWDSYSFERYDNLLSEMMQAGQRIYSAAYIMPSRAGSLASPRKHRNHLRVLEMMMEAELPARLPESRSAADAFTTLRSFPMVGDFLGYQFLTDLIYGPLLDFSEMDFVVAGPGARSGLKKCFSESGGLSPAELIRLVADSQEEEFRLRGIDFLSLWGRPLQLIDCQNLFCEVDKYARVAHPEFNEANGRVRIKQNYRANPAPLRVWFPPKWKVNERIPSKVAAI